MHLSENELFGIYCGTMSPEDISKHEATCTNYRDLQFHIMGMPEKELIQCIIVEKCKRNRVNILNRLYARFSEVRKNGEKLQLFS